MSNLLLQRIICSSLLVAIPGSLYAVDGVVLINQSSALQGGVTPGDAPGFPVTISQPGSYRLSSNLVVPDSNTNAIEITAEFVTLDLNGFSIVGGSAFSSSRKVSSMASRRRSGLGPHSGSSASAISF